VTGGSRRPCLRTGFKMDSKYASHYLGERNCWVKRREWPGESRGRTGFDTEDRAESVESVNGAVPSGLRERNRRPETRA